MVNEEIFVGIRRLKLVVRAVAIAYETMHDCRDWNWLCGIISYLLHGWSPPGGHSAYSPCGCFCSRDGEK